MPGGDTFICPVCGSAKWRGIYKIDRWDIVECAVCGLARIDPLPNPESRPGLYSKENVISRDLKQQTPPQRFFRAMKRLFKGLTSRDKNEIFYNKFSRYLPAGSRILDVGCGDGSFLRLAKGRFASTGIEISGYLADLAKQQGDIKVATGDFLSTDLSGEKFDGITLISLLEHLSDPRAAIKKCFDLMRPGGVLLIKTVNYGCVNRAIRKRDWTGFRPPDHVFYFTPSNLVALLKKIGFHKVSVSASPFNDNMYCDTWK